MTLVYYSKQKPSYATLFESFDASQSTHKKYCTNSSLLLKLSVGKITNYFKEVRLELSKVTWPKKEDVTKLTLIVFLFSAIVAIYLGGLDLAFTKLLEVLLLQ